MPYPTQINRETILTTARQFLEQEGLEAVSLHKLAEQLGVKAPSLYRYFSSKTDLLNAINTLTAGELVGSMQAVIQPEKSPAEIALAMFHAYRDFALAHPVIYQLLHNTNQMNLKPDAAYMEQLALPLQAVMAELMGQENSLEALRGAWALVHGFVMLELNEQFQREGDLNLAFQASIQAYLRGWVRQSLLHAEDDAPPPNGSDQG